MCVGVVSEGRDWTLMDWVGSAVGGVAFCRGSGTSNQLAWLKGGSSKESGRGEHLWGWHASLGEQCSQIPYNGTVCPKPAEWVKPEPRQSDTADSCRLCLAACQALDTSTIFHHGLDCLACCQLAAWPCPCRCILGRKKGRRRGSGRGHQDWKLEQKPNTGLAGYLQ